MIYIGMALCVIAGALIPLACGRNNGKRGEQL